MKRLCDICTEGDKARERDRERVILFFWCSEIFAEALLQVGAQVELILYKGKTHTDLFIQVTISIDVQSLSLSLSLILICFLTFSLRTPPLFHFLSLSLYLLSSLFRLSPIFILFLCSEFSLFYLFSPSFFNLLHPSLLPSLSASLSGSLPLCHSATLPLLL